MTDLLSPTAKAMLEAKELLERKEALLQELAQIEKCLRVISGKCAGKRSYENQLKQLAEMMHLDSLCKQKKKCETEKEVIMSFLKWKVVTENRRLGSAVAFYPSYRRALTRFRARTSKQTQLPS